MKIFINDNPFRIIPAKKKVILKNYDTFLVEANNNTLTVRFAPNLGSMYSDITKVRQVLFNLLSNAGKFTFQGEVTLTVSCEMKTGNSKTAPQQAANQSGSSPDPAWLLFRVADTGIGLSADQTQTIFQPFTQADASTTREYGGVGLGLAISHHFCRMLGGDITVESELGQGSTFTIRLPKEVKEDTPQLQFLMVQPEPLKSE